MRLIIPLTLSIVSAPLTAAHAQTPAEANSTVRELQEVIVTANQPATRLKGTTLVSTIAGSALEDAGSALDVLRQLPMLTVDDNSVAVTGRGIPEIYIDGRPMRDDDELVQLQSDNIRNVELLLAPGAMYATDTRAVLKITTKRRFLDGLSVLERAEVKARRKWSANELLDLDYRAGGWNIFGSASIARNNSLIKGETVNTLTYDGKPATVGSTQQAAHPSTNGTAKAGVNYGKGELSAGAYYRFNPERGDFENRGSEWLYDDAAVNRDIRQRIRARSHLVSTYLDNTFGSRCRVHFDGLFKNSHSDTRATTIYPDGNAAEVNSTEVRDSRLWAGKLYMTLPLWRGELMAGVQDSYTRTSLDHRMLNAEVGEYIPSGVTDVRQTASAAFASWSRNFGQLDLSAGVRYEYTDYVMKTNGQGDDNKSRRDHSVTPDISASYSFGERGQVSLSYKTATIRPPYSQLTGSLVYTGRHEIEGGNPSLRDERMHDVQLFGMWGDFMLQADATRSLDTYGYVKRVYEAPTLQLLMQPVNIDVTALSVYLIWSRRIGAWTPDVTAGVYRQWLELNGQNYNRPIFSYYFNNTFSLPHGFMITANISRRTGGDIHTNRFGTTAMTIDVTASKSFFDKKLQVRLSATDVFNTRNDNWSMNTFGVLVDKRQSYDSRGVSLSITWKLRPRKSSYKGEAAAEAELNRL